MSKDTTTLLLLAAAAVGGFYLIKSGALENLFSSFSNGGSYAGNNTFNYPSADSGNIAGNTTIKTSTSGTKGAVYPAGTIIQQVSQPNISHNSPLNTVIVAPNVKTGQVTVIPIQHTQRPPLSPIPAQPPLKIVNVFGFPVVPILKRA